LRNLPDPNLTLREAADFILESSLGRKALKYNTFPEFPVFMRDLITEIYKLTLSCHLPEFTDHGLSHLCSLVDRISLWTKEDGSSLVESLPSDEDAAALLLAVLVHDIGMLSQKPEDLDDDATFSDRKGQNDISTWVRRTHAKRIIKLTTRLFPEKLFPEYQNILDDDFLNIRVFPIAKSHVKWPWENIFKDLSDIDKGLAAVLAVSDLLDEDGARCDTYTLINHRQGTLENIAHWIRHALTRNRVLIENGQIQVILGKPPGTSNVLEPAFTALRNHYLMTRLYHCALRHINAHAISFTFDPCTDCPIDLIQELNEWQDIPGIFDEHTLLYLLLNSFDKIALLDEKRADPEGITGIAKAKLLSFGCVDLSIIDQADKKSVIISPIERHLAAKI